MNLHKAKLVINNSPSLHVDKLFMKGKLLIWSKKHFK